MAEYYPLITRAVAGLRDGAPEARQAIYGRAKQALIGQLRGMQPPVPEEAIDREIKALDEAVARIEAELAPAPAPPVAAVVTATPPTEVTTAPAPPVSATPAAAKPLTSRPAAPIVAKAATPAAQRPERAVFEPRTSPPAARSAIARPARPSVPVPATAEVKEAAPALAPARPEPARPEPVRAEPVRTEPARPEVIPSEPTSPAVAPPPPTSLPSAPMLDTAGPSEVYETGWRAPIPEAHFDLPERSGALPSIPDLQPEARIRDETIRPAIPRPPMARPGNLRVWIVAVAALAAVIAIALTAWKLRDRPEELARVPTPSPQADSTPGKIVERADGTAPADDDSGDVPAPVAGSTPTPAAAPPQAAATDTSTPQPAGEQAIPVSYKAAILVAAPDTPEKVKTYVGSVIWRSENVTQGQDQPLGTAVRADIDVPEAKIKLVMQIRKNTEAQFPASHTIDLKFAVGSDSPMGSVKQIDVPQMRREDAPTGDPLIGVPVTITGNYFLVGLTRGEAEARNVDAMQTRGWFDIPMVLEDGRPAKITFEKGASGDRIMNDALAAWGRS